MTSLDALENALHITREESHTLLQLGPSFIGDGPSFEMRDETSWDRFKKLLRLATDEQIYKSEEVDKRFFISGAPSPLYGLSEDSLQKLASLPPQSTVSSNGRILSIKIPGDVGQERIQQATDLLREIHHRQRQQIELFSQLTNAQEQPRPSWDICPDPQLLVFQNNIEISISIPWYAPLTMQALNTGELPSGIVSIKEEKIAGYADDDQPLLQELLQRTTEEKIFEVCALGSIYSSMNNNCVRLLIYSKVTEEKIKAAIELLALLATPPTNHDPFR